MSLLPFVIPNSACTSRPAPAAYGRAGDPPDRASGTHRPAEAPERTSAKPGAPEPVTPPGCPSAVSAAVMRRAATYDDLRRAVEQEGTDVANRRSCLKTFMRVHGRAPDDAIGPELRDAFPEALARFADAAGAGGAGNATVTASASRLRAVQRLVPGLEVLVVLGGSFSAVLDAALAAGSRTPQEVAALVGVARSTIGRWRRGGRPPCPPQDVVLALERALDLPERALLALLPTLPTPAATAATGFALALRDAIAAAGLSPAAAAARAGIDKSLLYSWTKGVLIPGLVTRERDLPRLERTLGLGVGALTRLLPDVTSRCLVYRAAFTPGQAAEYARFVAYKTDTSEHRRDRRPREFWRTRPGDAEGPSEARMREFLEGYYGYSALPPDHPHPLLRGPGLPARSGSLADLAESERVIAFLKFRAARARHDHVLRQLAAEAHRTPASAGAEPTAPAPPITPPPSGFNGDTWAVVAYVRSMLRRETGYLWQAHQLGSAIAAAFPALPPAEALAAWRAKVERADDDLHEFQRHLVDAELLAPTRDHARIERILALPRPMAALAVLCDRARVAFEQSERHGGHPVRQATRLRDFVVLSLLCVAPLRLSHWETMTYRAGGGGHLRKVADPASPHHGHYELHYPVEAFKALAEFRKEPYTAEVPPELTPYLDRYLREFRPLLVGAHACDFVFRPERLPASAGSGAATAAMNVDVMVANATRRLIPEYAPRGFRTHAFRHIIATHLVRNYPVDGVQRAADALHNTVAMIRKHYGHLSGVDRTRRSMAILQHEYRQPPAGQ